MKLSMLEDLKVFQFLLFLELSLLKYLPHEFKLQQKELNNYLLLQIELDSKTVKSSLIDKTLTNFQFDIIIDPQYPIIPPRVHTLTSVLLI